MSEAATLAHEDVNKPLVLTTDASGTHTGAVLEQFTGPDETATRPLAFFSRKLPGLDSFKHTRGQGPPLKTFTKELLGIWFAVRYFKYRLNGRQLIIRTDHAPLVSAFNKGFGEWTMEDTRRIYEIKQYNPELRHIEGTANAMADFLSRPATGQDTPADTPLPCQMVTTRNTVQRLSSASPPDPTGPATTLKDYLISADILATAQLADPTLIRDIQFSLHSVDKESTDKMFVATMVNDNHPNLTLYGVRTPPDYHFRPIVPADLQAAVFSKLHGIIHQGQKKSVQVISAHYYWPTMTEDIKKWVKACPKCQSCKTSRHNRARLCNFPSNHRRLSTIHMDLVGKLNRSNGFYYVFTMRDRETGFTIATPLVSKTSSGVIRAFKKHFLAVFGVPSTIITDRGGEFLSAAMADLCKVMGIKHQTTTAYHAQSNGFIERIHRTLKTALRALEDPSTWSDHLHSIVLTLNNLTVDCNHFTPYQKVFGQPALLPGMCLFESVEPQSEPNVPTIRVFFENMRMHHRRARPLRDNNAYIEKNLFTCDLVWVKEEAPSSPLSPLYHGPYKVLNRHEKFFSILTNAGLTSVSVDRIKAATTLTQSDSDIDSSSSDTLISDSTATRRSDSHITLTENPETG